MHEFESRSTVVTAGKAVWETYEKSTMLAAASLTGLLARESSLGRQEGLVVALRDDTKSEQMPPLGEKECSGVGFVERFDGNHRCECFQSVRS